MSVPVIIYLPAAVLTLPSGKIQSQLLMNKRFGVCSVSVQLQGPIKQDGGAHVLHSSRLTDQLSSTHVLSPPGEQQEQLDMNNKTLAMISHFSHQLRVTLINYTKIMFSPQNWGFRIFGNIVWIETESLLPPVRSLFNFPFDKSVVLDSERLRHF